MIKKRLEFKILTSAVNLEARMTLALLDGYILWSPIIDKKFAGLTAVMAKDIKVTKESLPGMILSDFNVEIGTVLTTSPQYRFVTLKGSEKVIQFCTDTARRYKITELTVWNVLEEYKVGLTRLPELLNERQE